MSKKRPRLAARRSQTDPATPPPKSDPAYWVIRLFKNTYTTRGRVRQTRNWCVKLQHHGTRRTLSLLSGDPAEAAAEACRLYRVIRTEGWETLLPPSNGGGRNPASAASASWPRSAGPLHAAYWTQRLVRREYTMKPREEATPELCARIEHQGSGYYFLLGTANRAQAAARALRIYRAVLQRGWDAANQRFSRELTVAFHWLDLPLAWTYTTIHTVPESPGGPAPAGDGRRPARRRVAVVESDAGIRRALAWCLNHMHGFACVASFATAAEALTRLPRLPVHLALVSSSLADQPGVICLRELRLAAPARAGLLYSVYEDSEELFRRTPGGATNYLLRRTPATGLLAPLAGVPGAGTLGDRTMPAAAWQYFKNVFSMPLPGASPRPLADLTPREHEVLARLSQGSSDKEIAGRLAISVHTVHEHVRNIFEKLGVHNRTEAVVKFLQK